ncbi:type II secretion system F family protein [Paenarthrobacter sp. Z7-10]|nr:type II secretion system F family protein [Paenarthrobacter sp. Z7-10]
MMVLCQRPDRTRWKQRLQMWQVRRRRGPRWVPVQESAEAAGAACRNDGIEDVPLMLELLATAFDAGLPMVRALEVLAGVANEATRRRLVVVVAGLCIGASWSTSWSLVHCDEVLETLHSALTFAALTGAPSSALLDAEAAQIRRIRHRTAERRAAALGVKLVLPLGLCFLPAFVCLGIVPVVLAMVPSFR